MNQEITLHPVVIRLIKNSPNFRRGWQLAQMGRVNETAEPAQVVRDLNEIWQGACTMGRAAQRLRDRMPGRYDWQSRKDRERAIRAVAAEMLRQALEADRAIL